MKTYFVAALLLLGITQGLQASDIDCSQGERCFEPRQIDWDSELEAPGSKVQFLLSLCPTVKNYMNCKKAYTLACSQQDKWAREIYAITDILDDLCNNETDLHQKAVNNIDCGLKNKEIVPTCSNSGRKEEAKYEAYRESLGIESRLEIDIDAGCLVTHLVTGCIATETLKACGEEAMEALLEVMVRSTTLCPQEEALVVQQKYLEMKSQGDSENDVDPPSLLQYLDQRK